MSTPLGPDDVHVWHRPTGDGASDADLSDLSSDERARCARLVFARDRRAFAAAHALLRSRLSLYGDTAPAAWTFDSAAGGKPFIVASPGAPTLTFNLSHTHGLVACAIAGGDEVGIDVESVDRTVDSRGIAERFFAPAERDWLGTGDPREQTIRFIEVWTLKEAYIKATGRGLGHPLNAFAFGFEGERQIRFSPPRGVRASAWRFALFAPSPRYRMAVAAPAPLSGRGSMLVRSAEGAVTEPIRMSELMA